MNKINKLCIVNNGYVLPLKNIPSPLLELYYSGILPEERRPTVAIVGPRKPTEYGRLVTQQFASVLAKSGVIIVSGLAFGVDAIAHQAALDAKGTTIAVLAGGLHKIYPVSHDSLAKQILRQGGALVSENKSGYEARPYDFLGRNRLVSGLADAILIPEAAIRSGTLSTVRHALEQGKNVFVIPGPITSTMSAGSNQLLQQGAQVALRPEDILEVIAPGIAIQTKLPIGDTPQEAKILKHIRSGISDGDALAEECKIPISEFLQTMTMLELKGSIRPLGANRWAIKL